MQTKPDPAHVLMLMAGWRPRCCWERRRQRLPTCSPLLWWVWRQQHSLLRCQRRGPCSRGAGHDGMPPSPPVQVLYELLTWQLPWSGAPPLRVRPRGFDTGDEGCSCGCNRMLKHSAAPLPRAPPDTVPRCCLALNLPSPTHPSHQAPPTPPHSSTHPSTPTDSPRRAPGPASCGAAPRPAALG